ncbi:RHS repeat-associated core domain-containing protein [Cohnella luojiensis]|uniref:Teneurin-like YD-shell domain-containing protein n=1 Tax=Cohnella luojiensis TaxID=652876 RepID=A0A4Y8LTP7_9BACL|nr:RHS repeat-associated core domain-containing protein [Cohnella luojiensis]TFE19413.1 hypothetical protein E2980_23340 [Cohnella luojiensis]
MVKFVTRMYNHYGERVREGIGWIGDLGNSQKDGNTQLTSYDYDELGRRLQKVVVRGESGQDVFEYQYDPNDNVIVEKKPGGLTTQYQYDFMNRKVREDYNDGTWYAYTYDKAGNMLTRTDKNGTINYGYYDNNQLQQTTYPNGDTVVYEYNDNGEKIAEIVNGERTEYELDLNGRPTSYTDSKGYKYEYEYDADGYVTAVKYPNGTVTSVDYKPGHLIDTQKTTRADEALHASAYNYNAREFITGVQEQNGSSGYVYNDREQLQRVETVDGDVILYEYDGAGNRTVRKAVIQGTVEDKNQVITTEELVQKVLESFGVKPGKSSKPDSGAPSCEPNGNGNGNGKGNGNDNGNGNSNNNGDGNSNGNGKTGASGEVHISSNGNGGGNGNSGGNGNGGGSGNSGGNDNTNGNGNSGGNGNGGGNDNGNGNGKDKDNGNGNGKDNSDNGGGCGWLKSLEKGNGKKLGLYKKLGGGGDIDSLFETGQMEHILAAIDNVVNGEVNLPPGEHTKLFERIREVGKGYTVIGTNYTYNTRNQLVHRENLTRYEEYDYTYDDQGSLLTDSRSKFEWNALGQLTKVTFPDGFGEKYAYDMLGRRTSKTQFNHTGETQDVTNFTYKGDTWVITEERNALGEVTKSYTFDANDRPLSITYKGETFWYVYNGHGDVMAMTDKDGNIAARYEYDAWGLVTRMYNRYGERVREGIGWIGDLGTGNGSPGSVQGPEDDSGNTEPDYHPGNGNGNGKGNGKELSEEEATESTTLTEGESAETPIITLDLSAILTEETEPTKDITTDLVKENPFRYAGYYFDRKTQYYYLQARYYDPRPARFISEDTYEGEIGNPLTLNLYTYAHSNPIEYTDPTGHYVDMSKPKNDPEPRLGYNSKDGILIHITVESVFLAIYANQSGMKASTEVLVPLKTTKSGYGRADMVLDHNGVREVYELKPITQSRPLHVNMTKQKEANVKAKAQLQEYIDGFISQRYNAQPGTTFDPNGMILVVPGFTKQIVKLRTYDSDPGMIFFEIKDKPSGINIEDAQKVIAGAASVVIAFIISRIAPGIKNIRLPGAPPVSA